MLRLLCLPLLALAMITTGCTSSEEALEAKRGRCEELRGHRAELLLARSAGALSPDERAKHQRSLEAAAGNDYVAACIEQRSDEYLDCALAAASREELLRCDK